MKWYLVVVSICISPAANDVEQVLLCLLEESPASWTFPCLLWRNVSSGPLPVFKLSCLFIAEFREFFVYFQCKSLITYLIYNFFFFFFTILRVSFHFLN